MENRYSDKQTVDQAWDMMHATLDKAMPEKKKRRAIWWIPIFAGLLLAGGWYFMSSSTDTEPALKDDLLKRKVEKVIANNENKSSVNKTHRNQKEADLIPTQKQNENKNLNVNQETQPNKKAKTKTIANAKNKKLEKDEQSITPSVPSKIFSPVQKINKQELSPVKVEKSSAFANEKVVRAEKPLLKTKTSTLEVAISTPLDIPDYTIAESLPNTSLFPLDFESKAPTYPAIEIEKNSKWNIEAKVAYLNDVKFNSSTLLTETRLGRKLSPRWSILSGLGWKKQTLILFQSSDSDRFASQIETNITSGNQADQFTPYTNQEDLFVDSKGNYKLKSNLLYFSLGTRYRLKKNWEIEGGVHYNFLNFDKRETISSKPTHFSLYTSIDFKLSKKLAVFAQYQTNTQRFESDVKAIDAHQVGIGTRIEF